MPRFVFSAPWRITLSYALAALVCLWAAEMFADLSMDGSADPWGHVLVKAVLFVVVTAGLVHLIAERVFRAFALRDRAWRELETRWRQALEAAGDGMWELTLPGWKTTLSTEWLARLGYAPRDFGGRWEDWLAWVHSDDRARLRGEVERFEREPAMRYSCEFRVRTKAGGYRWLLSRGRVVAVDGKGRPARLIGTHTDITVSRQAAQEVAEAAQRYRDLFDANPNPMWIYDLETLQIMAVNESAVQRYGYSREQFLALTILDLRTPEEAARLRETLLHEQGIQTGHIWEHRVADGSPLIVEITSQPLTWAGRRARVVQARDVTEQTESRRALEESRQRFSAIFHGANDAIFLIDAQARITDCNQRALEIFGGTAVDIIGRWVVDFFPSHQPDGSESRPRARAVIQEVAARTVGPLEWTLLRCDGTSFVSEVTVSALKAPHEDGYIIVVRDVTERKRLHERLQLLNAALHATADGWVITDAQGAIEWVNPGFTRMTGYEPDEVIGRNPRVLRSGRQDGRFYARMWETILRGEVWRGELQNRRKDGTLYDERMTVAPVRDASGRISHFVSTKQEITAERQLEQQLSRAQRLESIGMLASGIAHDLNNVLTPILLCVEFLKAEFPGEEAGAKLKLVEQAAKRGAGIVRQVLTFARGVEGEHSTLQPNLVLKEVGQLARETLPRNIAVRIEGTDEDGWLVEGDITQLHQALLNLVVNARDAMPEGGRLTLRRREVLLDEDRARRNALPPGRYVELSVVDTGVGISAQLLDRIFDPFFSTKPRGQGTGLGLSAVYGIVRGHGGAVEAQSHLGVGTEFALLLPALEQHQPSAVAASEERELSGDSRLVLIVDDEPAIREALSQLLHRRGFVTVQAEDGLEALSLFRLRPVSAWALAITDMMMPRMDGAALAQELKRMAPDLPVVGMSGMLSEVIPAGAARPSQELQVFDKKLPKPFHEAELVRILAPLLVRGVPGDA